MLFIPGCACCGAADDCSGTFTLTVTVTKCGGIPVSGSTVTLVKDGATHAVGVTNSSGVVVLAFSKFGSFTLSATSPHSGADPSSITTTLTCANASRNLSLPTKVGWNCCVTGCEDPPILDCASVTLSDGLGSITLTKEPVGSCVFRGCATRTATGTRVLHHCTGMPAGSGPALLVFTFVAGSVGGLTVLFHANFPFTSPPPTYDAWALLTGQNCAWGLNPTPGFGCAIPGGSNYLIPAPVYGGGLTCGPPNEWVFHLNMASTTGSALHPLSQVYGPADPTLTVTWCR